MVDEKNPILDDGGDNDSWALEVTQMKLLASLKKQETESKSQSKLIKSIEKTLTEAAPDAADFYKKFEKFSKAFAESSAIAEKFYTTDFMKASKKSGDIVKKTISEGGVDGGLSSSDAISQLLGGGEREFETGIKKYGAIIGSLEAPDMAGPLGVVTDGLKKYGERLAVVNPILGGMIVAFGAFASAAADLIKVQFKVWTELAQVGRTFSGSMFEMSATIYGAGLTLDEGAALLKKFSHVAASIGDKEFLSLQKQVRGLSSELGNYGLSVQQIAELTGSYIETQTALGIFGTMTERKQAIAINRYIGQLSTLSKLTGKNIQDIENDRKSFVETGNILTATALLAQRSGQDVADNFKRTMLETGSVMAAMPGSTGKMINEQLMNMAQFGNKAMGEFGHLTSVMGGDFSNIMDRMFAATEDGDREAAKTAMLEYTEALMTMGKTERETLARRAADGDAVAIEMNNTISELNKRFSGVADGTMSVVEAYAIEEKETLRQAENTKKLAVVGEVWRNMMGQLSAMMQGPLESMFDMFIHGFKKLNDSGIFQALVDTIGVIVNVIGLVLTPVFWALGVVFDTIMIVLGPVISVFRILVNSLDWAISSIRNLFQRFFDSWIGKKLFGDGKLDNFDEQGAVLTNALGGLADGIGDTADAIDDNTKKISKGTEEEQKATALKDERKSTSLAFLRERTRTNAREEMFRNISLTDDASTEKNASSREHLGEMQSRIREIDTELPAANAAAAASKGTTPTTAGTTTAQETTAAPATPTPDALERLTRSTERQNELLEVIAVTNEQTANSSKKAEPRAFEGAKNSI